MPTRGTIAEKCFNATDRRTAGYVVARNDCSDGRIRQAERIAQARFIQYLSGIRGVQSAALIAPEVQWESKVKVTTPGRSFIGEIDVLEYDLDAADPAANRVNVWEAKVAAIGGVSVATATATAEQEATDYVKGLVKEFGWKEAQLGSMPYSDYFEVEEYYKCNDGKTRVNGRYVVTTPVPGVVLVTELPNEGCPDRHTVDEEGHETTEFGESVPSDEEEPTDNANPTVGTTPIHIDQEAAEDLFRIYVGAQSIYQVLRTQSGPVCGMLAQLGPRSKAKSVSDAGDLCLTGEALMKAAFASLGPGATAADYELAASVMLPYLLTAVANGWITMDELAASLEANVVHPDEVAASPPAFATGDPHLISLDGLNYDLQAVGEFVLASVPGNGAEVQARFAATTASLSVVNSLAISLGGRWVELRPDGSVLIDGAEVEVANDAGLKFADGALLVREGDSLIARWPDVDGRSGVSLTWRPRGGIGTVGLSVPLALAGDVTGLLGDFDGDPSNDLKLRDGTQLASSASPTYLHDAFADSWRIHQSESMFTYPVGTSTLDYTDRSFPADVVTRGDFTEAQRVQAMAMCQAYGVAAGPSFDDCELDVMATGSWAYAASAAQVHVPSVVAGDAEVDGAGFIVEDFEGDLPNNFSATRVATAAEMGSFAGPFSATEQYRFYVSQLPGHDSVNVEFDVIALGTWDESDSIRLAVDDNDVAMSLDWNAAEVGTLPNGTQFRKLRVEVPVPHHLPQVAVTFQGSGLSAASGQGFGIDNASTNLNLVPAQVFAVDLVQGVDNPLDDRLGLTGAGRLESRGAVDSYAVHVPDGTDLYLAWGIPSSSLGWRLKDDSGAILARGLASDRGNDIEGVSGDLTLEVYAFGALPPVTQDYRLGLLWAPEPQEFPWDLTNTGSAAGSGSSGSGELETPRSVDRYHFTVGAGGSTVQMQWLRDEPISMTASLVKDDTGEVLFSTSTYDKRPMFDVQLAAGNYTFVVQPDWSKSSGRSGSYDFAMYTPPAAQTFPVTLATGVERFLRNANSVGQGSGVLETSASVDRYTITVPEARPLKVYGFSYSTSNPSDTPMMFRLTDANGTVIREGNYDSSNEFQVDVAAGTYTFEIFASPGKNLYNEPYWLKFLLTSP